MKTLKDSLFCKVREDLQRMCLKPPIDGGYDYPDHLKVFRFRWIEEDQMQVYYKGWKNAYSIDFEFFQDDIHLLDPEDANH